MRSTPFCGYSDLEPMPFDRDHRVAAKRVKEARLLWHPKVGCFVWDEVGIIEVPSPFPDRVYSVLNLGHFLRRFDTIENMMEKLIWLPTWHQARQICREIGVGATEIWRAVGASGMGPIGNELNLLYNLILKKLENQE